MLQTAGTTRSLAPILSRGRNNDKAAPDSTSGAASTAAEAATDYGR